MQGHGKGNGMCGSGGAMEHRGQGMGKGFCHGKRFGGSDVTDTDALRNRLNMLDKERDEVANRLSELDKSDTKL
ncbi:hypothetical protein [Candidatus Magnetomonas plexicatena]|uniref:hypothetical protein n=1 Tax=Candidatus Magnetomonas plexicatena TaxID=2552947 RepID=UPI001100EA3C|nr:DUF5320 domain-containing protein [Nitrospirales bacterium LBB_01]